MPFHVRLLADVQRAGRLGGKLPGVINTLQSFTPVDRLAKKIAGIHHGRSVYVPPQQCCGMPSLLEGNEQTTLDRGRINLEVLLSAHHDGYKLVAPARPAVF